MGTMRNKNITASDEIRRLKSRIKEFEKKEKIYKDDIKELRVSERKYRTIFENTGTITLIFDENTIITMVNTDFAKRMGYSKKEVEGKRSWTEFVIKDDLKRLLKYHALRSNDPAAAPHNHEFRVINRRGEVLNIFMTIDMIPGTKLRIASLIDITDRIRAEEELMNISERERHKIGQDLHDDLAPHLMGIEFLSKILADKLEKNSPADAPQIKKIRALIQEATIKTKRFARGLCPVHLADRGLESSLRELAQSTEEIYGTPCSFTCSYPAFEHDMATSTHIFYIAQEAVHNAIKHGRAGNIAMSLNYDKRSATLAVKDDGKGFDDKTVSYGMGLKIMKYRARMINASLSVKSGPGNGTEVIVLLPDRK